jgi:uncharacterized peroxidase-related enzyme
MIERQAIVKAWLHALAREVVMSFFRSLGAESSVRDILQMNRAAGRALIEYHMAVLRQPSPLTEGERELIAAYVSGLNSCQYCHGVHTITAEAFGLPEGFIRQLLDDVEAAPVESSLKPILKFVRKLTLEPSRIVAADAEAVFSAGWTEQALHDAINVCCLFNFMNRLVDGHGVKGDAGIYRHRGHALKADGYAPLLKALGA